MATFSSEIDVGNVVAILKCYGALNVHRWFFSRLCMGTGDFVSQTFDFWYQFYNSKAENFSFPLSDFSWIIHSLKIFPCHKLYPFVIFLTKSKSLKSRNSAIIAKFCFIQLFVCLIKNSFFCLRMSMRYVVNWQEICMKSVRLVNLNFF